MPLGKKDRERRRSPNRKFRMPWAEPLGARRLAVTGAILLFLNDGLGGAGTVLFGKVISWSFNVSHGPT